MASMSSITAAMESDQRDQELPPSMGVEQDASGGNRVHYYRPRPNLNLDASGYQGLYDYFLPNTGIVEENDPAFPEDPEQLNELMTNLALIVKAMRRMGVFEEEDDLNMDSADMDSVVPQVPIGSLPSTSTSTSTSPSDGVVDLGVLLGYSNHPAVRERLTAMKRGVDGVSPKKKTVRFQYDPKRDGGAVSILLGEEDGKDQFVPEMDENGNQTGGEQMMTGMELDENHN